MASSSGQVNNDVNMSRYYQRNQKINPWREKEFTMDVKYISDNDSGKLKSGDNNPDTVFIRLPENISSIDLPNLTDDLKNLHEKKPLHIYFLDCPELGGQPCKDWKLADLLKEHLLDMHNADWRVVIAWSGRTTWPGSVVHHALKELFKVSFKHNFKFSTLACISWNDIPANIQNVMKTHGEKHIPATQNSYQGSNHVEISAFSTHWLVKSDNIESDDVYCEIFKEIMNSAKDSREVPRVCILFNGGDNALKMVNDALSNNMPVIVIEKSGGLADNIANIYRTSYYYCERVNDRLRVGKKRTTLRQPSEKMSTVVKHLEQITIFNPRQDCLRNIIVLALQQHKELQIEKEVEKIAYDASSSNICEKELEEGDYSHTLDTFKNAMHKLGHLGTETQRIHMVFFIHMMLQDRTDIVKKFLADLEDNSFWDHFDAKTLNVLYKRNKIGDKYAEISNRIQVFELLEDTVFKLILCAGKGCPYCSLPRTISDFNSGFDGDKMRTCLHPIQELFLWALILRRCDMALVLWEHCHDKIASAVFAKAVFEALGAKCNDKHDAQIAQENAVRFQQLAEQTLNGCNDLDWRLSEGLLTKPCPWWGNMSVLQLAIETGNKDFLALKVCKAKLRDIWKAANTNALWQDLTHLDWNPRLYQLVDMAPKPKRFGRLSPRCRFALTVVFQLVFLGIFSYVMVTDFYLQSHLAIAIFIWINCLAFEEIRQLLAPFPLTTKSQTLASDVWRKCNLRWKFKRYIDDYWNIVDIYMTVVAWFAFPIMLLKHENGRDIARILLCVGLCGCYVRLFRYMMVFDHLGLMLVKIWNMVWDVWSFAIIVLVILVSYAVSAGALLYAYSGFSVAYRAYWQIYGELFLDDLYLIGQNNCTSEDLGSRINCPSYTVSSAVLIFVAAYVLLSNILLVNLLIAQFSYTFDKVHSKAQSIQAWLYCMLIIEFHSKILIPPPFSMILVVYDSVKKMRKFLAKHLERQPRHEVFSIRSIDGTSMDVFWARYMSSDDYVLELKVEGENDANATDHIKRYNIYIHPSMKQPHACIWNLNPQLKYSVSVGNITAIEKEHVRADYFEWVKKLREFEDKEVKWILERNKKDTS